VSARQIGKAEFSRAVAANEWAIRCLGHALALPAGDERRKSLSAALVAISDAIGIEAFCVAVLDSNDAIVIGAAR